MLKVGQLAKAVGTGVVKGGGNAAEYMPTTLEEFIKNKETGKWKYDFVAKYMENILVEDAKRFYTTQYTMKDLKQDLKSIKLAMKNVQWSGKEEDLADEYSKV